MPWANEVSSIVHAWYLGNSTGEAIADVLFGKVNPSGKMSLTFPKRLEDTPSYGHFHTEHGDVLYGEDLFVVSLPLLVGAVSVIRWLLRAINTIITSGSSLSGRSGKNPMLLP